LGMVVSLERTGVVVVGCRKGRPARPASRFAFL
jgi:hypothetical protein